MRIFALIVAVIGLLAACPAMACSVSDDYRVPTNLELTASADVIMLARVDSGPIEPGGPNDLMTVTPLEVLKGNVPIGKPIQVPGSIAPPRFAILSSPLQLEEAHPLAYIGACIRTMFVKDSTVLFFLQPAEKALRKEMEPQFQGMLFPAGGPFSRWAEDVLNPQSPWVRATRIYLRVSALPKDQQMAALQKEHDALVAAGDQDSKVIAEDVDRQMHGPNKPWNQLMREEMEKMDKAKAKGLLMP